MESERTPTAVSFMLASETVRLTVPVGMGREYLGDEVRTKPDGEPDMKLLGIDLWAHGEHITTYSGDYDEEIPLPDADWIVDAALRAGVFVPALAERT